MKGLKACDLHNGKIVYIAEPGYPVVKATVLYKRTNCVKAFTVTLNSKVKTLAEIYNGRPFKALTPEQWSKAFPGRSIPAGVKQMVMTPYYAFDTSVAFQIVDIPAFEIQEFWFTVPDSNTRLFSKLKHAVKYASGPKVEWADKESMFKFLTGFIEDLTLDPVVVENSESLGWYRELLKLSYPTGMVIADLLDEVLS